MDVDKDLVAGFLNIFYGFLKEKNQNEIKSTATDESLDEFLSDMPGNLYPGGLRDPSSASGAALVDFL